MYIDCVCIMQLHVIYLQVHVLSLVLMSQNWSKLQTSGEKPPARSHHSVCCMTGANPTLMVVGGWVYVYVLSDVWLLDVTDGSWSEVLHAHVQ